MLLLNDPIRTHPRDYFGIVGFDPTSVTVSANEGIGHQLSVIPHKGVNL
jgi:hypothetical protein